MSQNFPVQYVISPPRVVQSGVAYSYLGFSKVTVQVTGLSGGDYISVIGWLVENSAIYPLVITPVSQSQQGEVLNTITEDGLYTVSGSLLLLFSQEGVASNPTITALGSQV